MSRMPYWGGIEAGLVSVTAECFHRHASELATLAVDLHNLPAAVEADAK